MAVCMSDAERLCGNVWVCVCVFVSAFCRLLCNRSWAQMKCWKMFMFIWYIIYVCANVINLSKKRNSLPLSLSLTKQHAKDIRWQVGSICIYTNPHVFCSIFRLVFFFFFVMAVTCQHFVVTRTVFFTPSIILQILCNITSLVFLYALSPYSPTICCGKLFVYLTWNLNSNTTSATTCVCLQISLDRCVLKWRAIWVEKWKMK